MYSPQVKLSPGRLSACFFPLQLPCSSDLVLPLSTFVIVSYPVASALELYGALVANGEPSHFF